MDRPDDAATAAALFALFNEVAIVAQLSRTLLERRLPDGLLATHFGVLSHLSRLGDGRTPMRIARAFQTPKASMTHTLAGLQARGLIEMRPDPADGRGKLVFLTDAGRAVRAQALAATAPDLVALAAAGWTAADTAALAPGLARLRALLDRQRDATPAG